MVVMVMIIVAVLVGGNSNDKNYDYGSSNGNVKSNSGTMRKIILLEFIIDTFFMKFETPGFGYG